MTFRVAALIPTYQNPRTIAGVVDAVRAHLPDVLVVDDGSGPEGRAACAALADRATVHHRAQNGGKGAAVRTGFELLRAAGFTHALQVDGDGQHDLSAVPAFLAAGREDSAALVVGYPEYDGTVPRSRLSARKITNFWVDLEVGKGVIRDAMIGLRLYPIGASLASGARGNRMEFDVEIAVRMARAGVPIRNLPVRVRYLTVEEGGVSHFRPFWDNVRMSWFHSRICTAASFHWVLRQLTRPFRKGPTA